MERINCWNHKAKYSVHRKPQKKRKLCCMFIWNKAIFLPLLRLVGTPPGDLSVLFTLTLMGAFKKISVHITSLFSNYWWCCYVYTVLNKKAQYLKVYKRFLWLQLGKPCLKLSFSIEKEFNYFRIDIEHIQLLFEVKLFLLKIHCKLLFENIL